MIKKVCVMGLGYIGLPTSVLLASSGYQVIGVDINENIVNIINSGAAHIIEPDLNKAVEEAVKSGQLKAYTTPDFADVFIISVPTPFYKNSGEIPQPNLEYVLAAAESIAPLIRSGNVIILESTSPVGTTEMIKDTFVQSGIDVDSISIAYCPERVLPGNIMKELVENDRIVGGINESSTLKVKEFYQTFVKGNVLSTDCKTAEMCKLVENSYRDTNIAFANELSILCSNLGINVWKLIDLANHHPRVNILQPGCGVGGHCIAVDPWFIVAKDSENAKLIKTVREVNNYKSQWVVEKIKAAAYKFEIENGKKPIVACMGLAFKPNIDDLRESPALNITKKLVYEGINILAVEPNIKKHEIYTLTKYQVAIETADILVFLVKHKEFLNLDVEDKLVLDFCAIQNYIKETKHTEKLCYRQ